jgi:RNA polymerase sigma-70 factor (ECF subfamily)
MITSKMHTPLERAHEAGYWSELLERLGEAKDEAVFCEIHAHFAPLIRSFLQSRNPNLGVSNAEDIVQDVMTKVWFKADSFDSKKAAASTWIYTLARNAHIDLMRKNGAKDAKTDPLTTEDIWEDETSQPYIYLYQSRAEEQVANLMGRLPVEQRTCLEKAYMEGKSHSEIASELGLPLGTVKSRVRLGLKRMQEGVVINYEGDNA